MLFAILYTSKYCPTCREVEGAWRAFKRLYGHSLAFIEIEYSEETRKLMKRNGISWVPAVVIYDEEWREVKRVEGNFTLRDLEEAFSKVLYRLEQVSE